MSENPTTPGACPDCGQGRTNVCGRCVQRNAFLRQKGQAPLPHLFCGCPRKWDPFRRMCHFHAGQQRRLLSTL